MRSAAVDRRLEAIAGPPLATISSVGSATLSSALGPFEGRTIYGVVNMFSVPNEYRIPLGLGNATGGVAGIGRMAIIRLPGNNNMIQFRVDTAGNEIWWELQLLTSSVPKVVVALNVEEGMSGGSCALFSTVTPYTLPKPAEMRPGPLFCNHESLLFGAVYRGRHSDNTMRAVSSWLAQRYQVTPPPRAG